MYLVSLHGHATSACPGSSGAPTECRPGTNAASSPNLAERCRAHAGHDAHRGDDVGRVGDLDAEQRLVRGERPHAVRQHVHRPAAHRAAEPLGEDGLHVVGVHPVVGGPGVTLRVATQMNVRSSTRATSVGSDAHQNEFGCCFGFSRMNVPDSTSWSVIRVHSSADPSHHTTRSGWVSWAVSADPGKQGSVLGGRAVETGNAVCRRHGGFSLPVVVDLATSKADRRVFGGSVEVNR